MSKQRRKKKKKKPHPIEEKPEPLATSEVEEKETFSMKTVEALEEILDELEANSDSTIEIEPPHAIPPPADFQESTTEDISTALIKPPKPSISRKSYSFPEPPKSIKSVDTESKKREVLRIPTKVAEKPDPARVETKPKPKLKPKVISLTELSKTERERIITYEGDLYASIATLDFLTVEFTEHATVPPDKYRRYLRTLLRSADKAQHALEKLGVEVPNFIERENLAHHFPKGIDILDKHLKGVLVIPSYDLTQLPRKSATFVSICIELIDLLRLGELARVELLLPLLDDLARVLESISFIRGEYWSVKEIREWIKTLELERPETILSESLAGKLELQADRWLRDFKNQLSNI
ncbi:MAG: hypothetical protein ACE5R6_10460 [Candidatus Heimdallarchaeota archaeon]